MLDPVVRSRQYGPTFVPINLLVVKKDWGDSLGQDLLLGAPKRARILAQREQTIEFTIQEPSLIQSSEIRVVSPRTR
jgi:hypothetical protein